MHKPTYTFNLLIYHQSKFYIENIFLKTFIILPPLKLIDFRYNPNNRPTSFPLPIDMDMKKYIFMSMLCDNIRIEININNDQLS